MKKLYMFIFILILSFVINISFCNAATYAIITGTGVNVRSENSTNSKVIGTVIKGKSYILNESKKYPDNGGCGDGWYKINYETTTGFVCSKYISVYADAVSENPSNDCESKMNEAGFPTSYWGGLCNLKKSHPNWNFVAIKTDLDWASAIDAESACGKSLIQTNNEKYLDSSCKAKDGSFKAASKTAVAYYMDPRNWFTEKYIFQFEFLKYDENISSSYTNGSLAILKNSSFYNYHNEKGNNIPELVNTAGKETGVNPIFLSSRMLQELGSGTSLYNVYSGIYDGYDNEFNGFYNFFNIGVTTSCNNEKGATYCGLSYAKNNGWNSVYNAIKGGSSYLGSGYINVGQYVNYLQKYNIVPNNPNSLYLHQYMTNVAAPSSESTIIYSSYDSLGLLDMGFTFYIPVYLNMDNKITNTSSGGSGDNSTIVSDKDVSEIVTQSGFTYSSGYLSKIEIGTDISDIISSLKAISGTTVVVKDQSGNATNSGKIATGYKVVVHNDKSSEELTAVVKGDTSGDGQINALDLLQVQKAILGTYGLDGAYKLAGDTSGDGQINALDLLQVQKSILGTYKIVQ